MAETDNAPVPSAITLHQRSRVLELVYGDPAAGGRSLRIPYELMRVLSPSAEVRGHGPGQAIPQTGKREVEITGIEPVGNYGLRPAFSDGHASGIYTWSFLWDLGANADAHWQSYFDQIKAAGLDRDRPMPAAPAPRGHHH